MASAQTPDREKSEINFDIEVIANDLGLTNTTYLNLDLLF